MNFWYLKTNEITLEDEQVIKKLFPIRYKRTLQYINHEDYLLSLGAYLLLLKAFGTFKEEDVFYKQNGKPYIKNKPLFNYSHSKNLVVLVTNNDNEIGVDLEILDDRHNKDFYVSWTRKEALLKLTGEGMKIHNENIDLNSNEIIYKNKAIKLETIFYEDKYVISTAIYR